MCHGEITPQGLWKFILNPLEAAAQGQLGKGKARQGKAAVPVVAVAVAGPGSPQAGPALPLPARRLPHLPARSPARRLAHAPQVSPSNWRNNGAGRCCVIAPGRRVVPGRGG